MGWSPSVKAEALVACQRTCCICHAFRGGKMELHHIVQECDGGESTFENCIPVCFDCHAEVGHYNTAHPKGTKFSSDELKMHRDRWLEKVARGGTVEYDSNRESIDKRIANEIHNHMMTGGGYDFLKYSSLWESHEENQHKFIFRLSHLMMEPDFEFCDPELESARAVFAKDLNLAMDLISVSTGPVSGHVDLYNVMDEVTFLTEWSKEDQDELNKKIDEADNQTSTAAAAYDALYKVVRQKLGLDLRFDDRDPNGQL